MKMIYQQMLAFLMVILSTIAIVAIVFTQYTTKTVYNTTFDQLEGYANVLEKQALKQGDQAILSRQFINDSQAILSGQHVFFNFFSDKNKMIFPDERSGLSIKKTYWKELKKGKTQRLSLDGTAKALGSDQDQLVVFKPVFNKDKLVYVIGVAASVKVVKTNITSIIHNLWLGFTLSVIGAILISYFFAKRQISRINRLKNATHLVAEGDFDINIKSNDKDEIDELANDFNYMVASLSESQKEIKRQEERRRQFMADAAHEMRTPLTTIKGLLEGLSYDMIPKEMQAKSLDLMQSETNRLIRLVNENLDYEKLRTNQIKLNLQNINATDVFRNIKDQLSQKATEADDEIILDLPDEINVYADYDRFVQVMFNIMQNAIQFTKNGQITISAKQTIEKTVFKVSDTGIGMSEDQLKNIWERYYKADVSRKNTKFGESGLGLAIVHQLVQLHGGSIEAKSILDQGSTFEISFPNQ